MQKKMIARSSQVMLSVLVLSFPLSSQGSIAYIPQALRECISVAHEITEASSDTRNLQELHAMIKENRILASDNMTRMAVKEAFNVIEAHKNDFRDNKQHAAIKKYLKEYVKSLDNASILLAIQGEGSRFASWPISFVARSLPGYSVDRDMMHLSSELASTNNIQLCGNVAAHSPLYNDLNTRILANVLKNFQVNSSKDPSIIISSTMMTNSLSNNPNVIFGTGVSSPIINTWSMAPSTSVQSPINMQFSIPADLKIEEEISLELHFLVKQQLAPAGKVCIRVDAKYMHNNADFDILASDPIFNYTNNSSNFKITEPSSADSLKHVSIVIPLQYAVIKNLDLAFLSLTRIAPVASAEYEQDIYLASAVFRYTRIDL